ncbi:hypothetical protein LIER_11684 [Lithospermum erythrorhizon]|uniref:CCHC-type domain-containing protein n=1 Tax=Lithospermum erythrorhizon TaxID=34254 RepID=A0AAV3PQU2_LITER
MQGGSHELTDNAEMPTRMFMEKVHYNKNNPMVKGDFRKKEDKSHLKCTNCGKVGHVKTGCFRIVRFPEWWENPKGNGQINRSKSVNVNNVSYEEQGEAKTPLDHTEEMVNFAIVKSLVVKSGGQVKLNNNIILVDWLLVPMFNYNLLSVSRLGRTAQIQTIFLLDFCLLQDIKSFKVLAVGKEKGGLYVLDSESFLSPIIDFYSKLYSRLCFVDKPIVNNINKTINYSAL